MKLVLSFWGLLLSWSLAVGAVSSKLRRVAQPSIEQFIHGQDKAYSSEPREKRLMDMITKFRAGVCFKMKEEHGKKFESYDECDKFMNEACDPGKDKQMDGDRKEVTSGEGYCKEYFPEARKKAEAEIDKQDKEAAGPAPGPSTAPGPAPAPAPAPKKEAPAPAPAKASAVPAPAAAGSAPAPSPAGAPGPAPGPVPGPYTPGKSGGKPYGKIEEDHAYYYKKGGKDPSRMHMNADLGLPDQGYWGKLIEHEDKKTVTGDWGEEFGPGADKSLAAICKKHPDNPWCEEHYHRHSSCPAISAQLVPLVCAFIALGFF